jgi:hypothetical protein
MMGPGTRNLVNHKGIMNGCNSVLNPTHEMMKNSTVRVALLEKAL